MTRRVCWLPAVALLVATAAAAQDDEAPDLAFLEYLGSWQDGDEDWLVVAEEWLAAPDGTDEDDAAAAADDAAEERQEDAEQDEQD